MAPGGWIDLPGTFFRSSMPLGRGLLVGLACLALTACGGGGGGGGGNSAPTAAIAITPPCGQAPHAVTFDASGSRDPDGSISSYNWSFGDNSSGSGATVSHTYATVGTFEVTLTVTDNEGARATATTSITTIAGVPPSNVAIGGMITFERVPLASSEGDGLDYTRTFQAPAREVEVELVRISDQAVIQTAVTDAMGRYQFIAPTNTGVFVRAKALSRPAVPRAATWNIRVLNNTNSNALYVLTGSNFNSCVVNQTRNLKAATGWSGGFSGVYSGVRAAAPFAVLDTLYAATQFVITQGDSGVQLMPLSAYWSDKNVPIDGNFTLGQIGTTAYYSTSSAAVAPGIYVLGAANNDTDEFDQHVIAHEFLHYLEDAIGRSDTVGGPHSLDERLDMRVAFSEGYSNAFSAMVLNDPVYRDSFGTAQGSDFNFSLESEGTIAPGWYNEASVQRIIWDLFDNVDDKNDAVTLGYGPIHDVFTTELRDDVPLASLFPFVTALKQRAGVPAELVDRLVEAEQSGPNLGIVSNGIRPYAETETHSGNSDSSLPVYSQIAIGGSTTVCSDRVIGTYNKLGNRRFLRFTVPARQTISIRAECSPALNATCTGTPEPDPDFVVSRASARWFAEGLGNVETLPALTVEPGDYVIEIYEYSHVDTEESSRRGRTCMTVNITG